MITTTYRSFEDAIREYRERCQPEGGLREIAEDAIEYGEALVETDSDGLPVRVLNAKEAAQHAAPEMIAVVDDRNYSARTIANGKARAMRDALLFVQTVLANSGAVSVRERDEAIGQCRLRIARALQ